MATVEKSKAGLEDVVAASSAICYLDGERGVLAYFGYDIHDLARGVSFEEVCYLLWHGRMPNRGELGDLQAGDNSASANYRKAIRLTAQIASIVATYGRMKSGGGPIQPDPALGHAA